MRRSKTLCVKQDVKQDVKQGAKSRYLLRCFRFIAVQQLAARSELNEANLQAGRDHEHEKYKIKTRRTAFVAIIEGSEILLKPIYNDPAVVTGPELLHHQY